MKIQKDMYLLDKMNVRSKSPHCNSVRIVEIAHSNVGNKYDLNKACCDTHPKVCVYYEKKKALLSCNA